MRAAASYARVRPSLAASRATAFALVVAALASTGAACPQAIRGYQVGTMPLPRTLPAQPNLDQIIATVHDNTPSDSLRRTRSRCSCCGNNRPGLPMCCRFKTRRT
jgi:hypothetical protein